MRSVLCPDTLASCIICERVPVSDCLATVALNAVSSVFHTIQVTYSSLNCNLIYHRVIARGEEGMGEMSGIVEREF